MNTKRAALWGLAVIFIANYFNYLDRQLVSALEEPLRNDLNLQAKEFGLLWTLFTLGYMLCAVPIGLMADKFSRTRIFAVCVVIWSIATVASGMATEKWVLYIARVCIGIGEAGCLVIGPSLISDLFDPKVRGKALSVFFLGMPLGGTTAFILAGLMFDWGWRNMFYAAGLPGFFIAVLIWFMRDPPRGSSEGAHHGMHGGGGMKEYIQLLKTKTLLLIILAQAAAVIFLVPMIHFGVEYVVEARDMDKKSARVALGLMALVAGLIGTSISGVLGDILARRVKGAYALLAAAGYLLGWPCLIIGFRASDPWVYFPALTLGCMFYFMCMPAVNTQIANVASPAQRATAWALAVFILHLLGDTLAPVLFGVVLDFGIDRQHAFEIFSIGMLVAGLCSLLAVFTAPADIARVAREVAESKREAREAPPALVEGPVGT